MTTNASVVSATGTSDDAICRVLIVEDNADASKTLAVALERDGHAVETTRNGTEALAVAADYRPHIVLIDIGLPGLDGFQVTKQLRQSLRQVLIVAVTGRSSPEDIQRSLDAGCDHHLVKPIDFKTIGDLLCRWKDRGGCHDKTE